MDEVTVFDARNRLSALLQKVEQGGEVTITRRGRPIAKLVPVASLSTGEDVVARLRALREAIAARGAAPFAIEELKASRDEGRR